MPDDQTCKGSNLWADVKTATAAEASGTVLYRKDFSLEDWRIVVEDVLTRRGLDNMPWDQIDAIESTDDLPKPSASGAAAAPA